MNKSIESRLKEYRISNNILTCSVISFFLSTIIVIFSEVFESRLFCIVGASIFFGSIIFGIFSYNSTEKIMKPFYRKLKTIGKWTNRRYDLNDITFKIYAFGNRTSIVVGIPSIEDGATISYNNGYAESSNAMERALTKLGIDECEFYLRFVEDRLLECMDETYNEIYKSEICKSEKVIEFVNKRIE